MFKGFWVIVNQKEFKLSTTIEQLIYDDNCKINWLIKKRR